MSETQKLSVPDLPLAFGDRIGRRPPLDFATVGGTIAAFALIVAAMVLGGRPGAFIDYPAILIVIGGTLAVTTISFGLNELARVRSIIMKAVLWQTEAPDDAATRTLFLAEQARRRGSLSLQTYLHELEAYPFLQRAVGLVVDGFRTVDAERIMTGDMQAMALRHRRSVSVLRRAAEVAPAMGLIGTLVGLVQMLRSLDDPSAIGPSMAVALLTTFYGAVIAHMVLLPLANKLERNAETEALVNQIYATGVASISRQENPRHLELVLNMILPPERRVRFFD